MAKGRKSTSGRKRTAKREIQPTAPDDDCVHQIYSLIIQGKHEHDIGEVIRQRWPDQDPKPLILAAMAKIAKAGDFDPDLVRAWCFEAYRELYRRMIAEGDYAGAIRAVKEIRAMT